MRGARFLVLLLIDRVHPQHRQYAVANPQERCRQTITALAEVYRQHIRDPARVRTHDDRAVGQKHRLIHVVCHQQGRCAAIPDDPRQFASQPQPGQRIECAQRLIQQQKAWAVDQCSGNGDTVRHAAGQLCRPRMGEIGQPDQFKLLGHAPAPFCRGQSAAAKRGGNVLLRGQPRQQPMLLKHHTAIQSWASYRNAINSYVALVTAIEPQDQPQQSRFAAAGRAGDGDELTVPNR
jgi:hypothetical protein